MSGGQQQRAAVARALVNSPSILLADEPTGSLDSATSIEIMAVLQSLNNDSLTTVMVTHEPDMAEFAKRVIVFRDGQILDDHHQLTLKRTRSIAWVLVERTSGRSEIWTKYRFGFLNQ
jgi:putative ABC transport system ATP-binding protein